MGQYCSFCQAPAIQNLGVCTLCWEAMPRVSCACPMCGIPVNSEGSQYCADCLQRAKPFQHSLVPCTYDMPVKQMVPQLKFHDALHYVPMMTRLMADKLAEHYHGKPLPEAVLAVPLHKKRLKQRGFNQALALAMPLAKQWQLPLIESVERVKATAAQSELDASQRRANIADAFVVKAPIPFQHIAIVDDVITTTETVSALAKTLQHSGVQRIDVWALARVVL